MAWRTAWIPPRSNCSATGICSGRSAASMALRCAVDVGAAGRSPRPGRPVAVAGATPTGTPGPAATPAPRPLAAASVAPRTPVAAPALAAPTTVVPAHGHVARRSPSSSRRRLPDPGARMTDTSGARLGVPLTSIRPSVFSGERAGFACGQGEDLDAFEADLDVGPQHRADLLARPAPGRPSTVPLGWRAPAARQVQDPSPVWLVSSMSMRRDMRRTRYLAWRPKPRCRAPSGASRNMERHVRRTCPEPLRTHTTCVPRATQPRPSGGST